MPRGLAVAEETRARAQDEHVVARVDVLEHEADEVEAEPSSCDLRRPRGGRSLAEVLDFGRAREAEVEGQRVHKVHEHPTAGARSRCPGAASAWCPRRRHANGGLRMGWRNRSDFSLRKLIPQRA